MPIGYRYDAALNTVFASAEDPLGDAELLEFGRRLATDPALPHGRRELIDLRGLSRSDVSSRALHEMAEAFRAEDRDTPGSRVAIVAFEDWAFGLSRMYQTFRDGSPVELRVFRELGAARAWLGLPDE